MAMPSTTVKTENRDKGTFWTNELAASKTMLEKFHDRGIRVIERYLDERPDITATFRLNLFHSNIKTLQDTLYSNLPKIETSRRNADSADDVARVASNLIERLLNLDMACHHQKYDATLRSVLQDRLLPGLGVARVRYEAEFEEVEVPAVLDAFGMEIQPATIEERLAHEDAPVEYFHWQDVLWGWGRNFAEIPWVAFRSYLNKEQVEERFPKAKEVEYKKQKAADVGDVTSEDNSPTDKAEIWEIWDKETKRVRWFNSGTILDRKDDPLQLKNFFPCPAFLLSNATTTLYRPVSDYYLTQDLYTEVDNLQSRIVLITEAVKVVGVYDAAAEGIQRMLQEGMENDLIPVSNWAMFAEGGGLKGKIDWFPLETVVNTLDKLRQLRDDSIALLQQITGMADVQQGSIRNPYEGVGQTQIKAQYGSVRVQALQDQFAGFITDLMQLKAEVICRHFDPQTIAERSNAQFIFDAHLVPQAIQLLKEPDMAQVRIIIRPETIAMIDYAKLKADRTEFLTAMATFMQSAAPLLQSQPNALPYLLKMLQWSMAGFKGSQEIEGVLDQAIDGATKEAMANQGQQKPDPEQQRSQARIAEIQAKAQADGQLREQDKMADMETATLAHQHKMDEEALQHQNTMQQIMASAEAKLQEQQVDLQANIHQSQISASTEMEKDQATTILEAKAEQLQHKAEAADSE